MSLWGTLYTWQFLFTGRASLVLFQAEHVEWPLLLREVQVLSDQKRRRGSGQVWVAWFFFPAEHCYLGECSCILCSGPGARMSAGGSGFHLVELYPSSWTSSLPGGPLQTALLSKTSLLFLVRVLFAPLFCLNKNPSDFEEFEPICDCRSCHLSLCHHWSNLWQKLSYSLMKKCLSFESVIQIAWEKLSC